MLTEKNRRVLFVIEPLKIWGFEMLVCRRRRSVDFFALRPVGMFAELPVRVDGAACFLFVPDIASANSGQAV